MGNKTSEICAGATTPVENAVQGGTFYPVVSWSKITFPFTTEMIKDAEKMIKEYINQYEYDIDYEFDVISEDDIKDEKIKNEIISLYKSIDEYKEQKNITDNKFNVYNKQNKKGYSSNS